MSEDKIKLQSRLLEKSMASPFSKVTMTSEVLQTAGPTLSTILAWIEDPGHASAVTSFFAGDFFLGRYSGNYYAKQLLPTRSNQRTRLVALKLKTSRICMHCWQSDRLLYLEDEAHMIAGCPLYHRQRLDLRYDVSDQTSKVFEAASPNNEVLTTLMSSRSCQDWQALGKFLARARQLRRKMRTSMQKRCIEYKRRSFEACKTQWRKQGKYICRHGVFFEAQSYAACACMDPPAEADWSSAVLMPAIDNELKCITVDTFDAHKYQRLGQLQAEIRRRKW